MTFYIVLIAVVILKVYFPVLFLAIFNMPVNVYYCIKDGYRYIRYKKWRICQEFGKFNIYISHSSKVFGSGKTLSLTEYATRIYKKYDGLIVYNEKDRKWEVQHIVIISNVELKGVPYKKLVSTDDIVNCRDGLSKMSVVLVLIDEAGSEFNSRNFKTNISSTLLNRFLTARHYKFGMFLTAQNFDDVDTMIRNHANYAVECRKKWRFMIQYWISAHDMEYCTNPDFLKYRKVAWFVKDKHYDSYDTEACVEEIKRRQKNGELLTDSEVMALQAQKESNSLNIRSGSRKLNKYRKRGGI